MLQRENHDYQLPGSSAFLATTYCRIVNVFAVAESNPGLNYGFFYRWTCAKTRGDASKEEFEEKEASAH
jgi:hypothetical protein